MKCFLILLIKGYRKYVSPLKPSCCRFYPSCSKYAYISIEKYGVFKGMFKILNRILRCNPFFEGGYDPP